MAGEEEEEEEEARLDQELRLLAKLKGTFASTLRLMQTVRDDLLELGNRMDRLASASQACREALKQQQESSNSS